MNLGAGRVVYQDLSRIDRSIREGEFFANPALVAAMKRCAGGRHALHLVGLVSQGGVHSHLRHLVALIEMARRRDVDRLFIHALTDGRDTAPTAAADDVAVVERTLADAGAGTNRDGDRPLPCHGSRPALGPDPARVRRDDRGPRAHRGAGRYARRRRLRGGHHRRVHRAGRDRGRRRDADRSAAGTAMR